MKRIEIIGTAYVGKSTLFQEICRNKDENNIWTTEKELYLNARKDVGYFNDFNKRFAGRFLKNTEIGKKYKYFGLSDMNKLDDEYLEKFSELLDLCFIKTKDINDIRLAFRVYHKMMERITKLKYYQNDKDQILLVEEFILHWHIILIKYIGEKNIDYTQWIYDEGLSPTGVIYCRAEEDVLKSRMKIRMQANTINKNHLNKNEDEITRDIINKQRSFEILTSCLRKNNIPVITLNTGLDLNYNSIKALKFIESVGISVPA
ncbi:MAG: hypothetical protein WD267_09495 [Balneolales bacterium]